jgi:hypothetical protein
MWRRSVGPIVQEMKKRYVAKGKSEILFAMKGRQAKWIDHNLRRYCLLKHVTGRKIEIKMTGMTRREENVSSYWMTLGENTILEIEKGNRRSHFLKNSLWERLWTCRKTDYAAAMMMMMMMMMVVVVVVMMMMMMMMIMHLSDPLRRSMK